jgi:hypothetical protein
VEGSQCISGDLSSQKINDFICGAHERTLMQSRPSGNMEVDAHDATLS